MKRNSVKDRRECFDRNKTEHPLTGRIALRCYLCHGWIDPAKEPWVAEHPTPHANGGTETLPAHPSCHAPKTSRDISEIAKGQRTHEKHFNIRRKRGFYRPGNVKFNWLSGRYERE